MTHPTVHKPEDASKRTRPFLDEGVNSSGPKDPYADKEALDKFVEDVEKFEKVVEGLSKQMLSGPTVMEKIWKVRVMGLRIPYHFFL